MIYEFIHYWYHKLAHGWTPLWRAAHQMHHSAESLEAFDANYLHLLDLFFTTWSSLGSYPLLGLGAETGTVVSVFLTFNAMFQHANLRTPRCLVYLIQRPESHALHHRAHRHRDNHSDLPLWDILFDTFQNPADAYRVRVGFHKGTLSRILEMLAGKDVRTPPAPTHSGTSAALVFSRYDRLIHAPHQPRHPDGLDECFLPLCRRPGFRRNALQLARLLIKASSTSKG